TSDLRKMGGLIHNYPGLGWILFLSAFILAGIPPLSGFIGKVVLLKGSFSNDQIIIGLVALVSSLLILYSIMKIFIYGFGGDKQEDLPKKSTKGLLSTIIFLVSISVFLGVGAELVYPNIELISEYLLDPEIYINSVLKEYSAMAFQIVVDLIISFMWMFLSERYTLVTFTLGYIVGIILLLFLNRFFKERFYLERFFKFIVLFLTFIRELIVSNIDIVKLVYAKNPDFEPGIFAMPIEVKKNWEITLLANLISLTPGTLSIAVSDDNSIIFIHAMHIDEKEQSIYDIKNTFEKAIMEVTK